MDNMINTNSSHNKKIINSANETNGKTCNCRNKSNCALDNKCLTNKIFCKTQIKPKMVSMSYLPKFTLVLTRQNVSPGTTTIQCHSETGDTKMIPNFRNTFGV